MWLAPGVWFVANALTRKDTAYLEKLKQSATHLARPKGAKTMFGLVTHESTCSLYQRKPPCSCRPSVSLVEPCPERVMPRYRYN